MKNKTLLGFRVQPQETMEGTDIKFARSTFVKNSSVKHSSSAKHLRSTVVETVAKDAKNDTYYNMWRRSAKMKSSTEATSPKTQK